MSTLADLPCGLQLFPAKSTTAGILIRGPVRGAAATHMHNCTLLLLQVHGRCSSNLCLCCTLLLQGRRLTLSGTLQKFRGPCREASMSRVAQLLSTSRSASGAQWIVRGSSGGLLDTGHLPA